MALIGYDEALARLAAGIEPLDGETIVLAQAQGRVLAAPVTARISFPAGDASAMDGIAVRDADVTPGTAVRLIGTSYAGQPFSGTLGSGEGVRIFTGALLPDGADRVIMQEHVRFEDDLAHVGEGYGPGWHVRRAGEDFGKGDLLLPAGCLMGTGQLLCAAGGDVGEIMAVRRPRVRILATGSELVEPGEAATHAATIPDSVSPAIAALVCNWGGEVVDRTRLPDDLPALAAWAGEALTDADVIVVTGGASVGARDFAQAMFADAPFEPVFSKVAIKPGKPVWVARSGKTWIVGLPGNPSSALVTARLFLAPLLTALGGRPMAVALDWQDRRIEADPRQDGDREVFLIAETVGATVRPVSRQNSGGQSQWALANCLLRSARSRQDSDGTWKVPCLPF